MVWKAILSHKVGRRQNLQNVLRQCKRWDFTEWWGHLMIHEVRTKLKKAKTMYKRFKPRAHRERCTYLGELANDITERDPNNKSAEHHYRLLDKRTRERPSAGLNTF